MPENFLLTSSDPFGKYSSVFRKLDDALSLGLVSRPAHAGGGASGKGGTMRNVGIGLSGVLLVGWWMRAQAQEDVDFRLPFSGGREVIRSSASAPGPRDLFNQKYGNAGGVVFWDEKLETTRFNSRRAQVPIARPDATESELTDSARNFVDG